MLWVISYLVNYMDFFFKLPSPHFISSIVPEVYIPEQRNPLIQKIKLEFNKLTTQKRYYLRGAYAHDPSIETSRKTLRSL